MGVAATLIIGFTTGALLLGSTATKNAEVAAQTATVQALAPICAAKFEEAANADNDLVASFAAVKAWQRDSHLIEAGWATFPGGAEPNNDVAEACAKLLDAALEIE